MRGDQFSQSFDFFFPRFNGSFDRGNIALDNDGDVTPAKFFLPDHVNIRRFADDISTSTNGALTITIHSAGSLFRHSEIKNAVRGEQIQMGEFLLSILSNENTLFQLDSVPFLATDYQQAGKLWQASRESDRLRNRFRANDGKPGDVPALNKGVLI